MPSLTIEKTYEDGVTPTSADFDNICDSLEIFLNVTKLGSDNIADNSITASSTFVAASITSDKIQNLAITTAKILNDAATTDKFATSSIITAKITDLNVTTAKIAVATVTDAKVAVGAVTAIKKAANGRVTGGTQFSSTGAATDGTGSIITTTRPCIYIGSGGLLELATTTTGVTMEGSLTLKRSGTLVSSQEFKAGPFYDTASHATKITIPSSSLFYMDITDIGTDTSISYTPGLDLTVGSSMTLSGTNTILEII